MESAVASFVLKLTASSKKKKRKKNHLRNVQLRLIAHLKTTRVMVGSSCNRLTSRSNKKRKGKPTFFVVTVPYHGFHIVANFCFCYTNRQLPATNHQQWSKYHSGPGINLPSLYSSPLRQCSTLSVLLPAFTTSVTVPTGILKPLAATATWICGPIHANASSKHWKISCAKARALAFLKFNITSLSRNQFLAGTTYSYHPDNNYSIYDMICSSSIVQADIRTGLQREHMWQQARWSWFAWVGCSLLVEPQPGLPKWAQNQSHRATWR